MAAAGVAIGLAVTALRYDLPLRTLLWDEHWWGWFAKLLGYSWKDWVTSPQVDEVIMLLGRSIGWLLLLGGGLLLVVRKPVKAIWVVFFILLIQHFLLWKDHFWNLGHLLEFALQTGAPLIFLYWIRLQDRPLVAGAHNYNRYWFIVRLLIASTFIGHGFYAAGVHPVPANFIFMTQSGLGVGEAVARQLLLVVGVLDFMAAILLMLPFRKAQIGAMLWIIPWAVLTTLARLWSYGGLVSFDTLLWQWLPEVVRRFPHVLVPVALWRALRADQSLKLGSST